MKELLSEYALYNAWANKLIIDAMQKLDEAAAVKEIVSSFPSVLKTVVHTWSAESIWLQRLKLIEHPVWQADGFSGNIADACAEWQSASKTLVKFVTEQADDNSFIQNLPFHDRQGVAYNMPVYQVLQHVFNHSTYHRGQLVTMLRQLGVTQIPSTDFIGFARLK